MIDVSKYIGLPYKVGSTDCWGLIRMVYADHLGIALPEYAGIVMGPAVNDLIEGLLESMQWVEAVVPEPYDVILLRDGRRLHIGMVVDTDQMLHTVENKNACLERFTRPYWAPSIIGFYQYAG